VPQTSVGRLNNAHQEAIHELTRSVTKFRQCRFVSFRGSFSYIGSFETFRPRKTYATIPLRHSPLKSDPRLPSVPGKTPNERTNLPLCETVRLGISSSPGTSLYVGYSDDLNYGETHPFTRQIVPGFRRSGRTYFIKTSYLFLRVWWVSRRSVKG
jgi:hypothetical protein